MTQTIGLIVDSRKRTPLFRQIVEQIVERIRNGTYPTGYRLPPTRELAHELGTHRNTVVRAYEELAASGFVESVVGRGTFVADVALPSVPDAPELPELPWPSLLSRLAQAEPLQRLDSLPRVSSTREMINLTRMQPPDELLPHNELRRSIDHVLRSLGPRALGYAPREGLARLRDCIEDDMARMAVPASADDLIVTTGSQQALDLVARALINPGDRVLVEAETYTGAIHVLTAAGARLVAVPGDDEGPLIGPLKRLGEGAKLFYLMPNCRNPTGAAISTSRRHELVEWSHAAGVPLVEDDYGADLELDENQPAPPALRALDRSIVYVSTFSKRLIPALRVGFVLPPPGLYDALLRLKQTVDLGTSALLQHGLAEFLERGYFAAHLKRIRPAYRARRDALVTGLREHLPASIDWHVPERGVVLWLSLPDHLPADLVFAEAQRQGVLISPARLHTVSGQGQAGLRLAYCFEPPHRLIEAARRLGRALRAVEAARPVPTTQRSVQPLVQGI